MATKKKAKIIRTLLNWLLPVFMASSTQAQQIIVEQGYAHNDYLHERPLLDALESGYVNIEADVFLKHNQLIVAHWFPLFKENRTLEHLYLAPLFKYVTDHNERGFFKTYPPITLHIDIKSSPNETYLALRPLLERYRSILSSCESGIFKQGKVNIVITGRKPEALIRSEKIRLVMMDECSISPIPQNGSHMYAMSSCRYSRVINWRGDGPLSAKDRLRLRQFAMIAHQQGKKARLWASPENDEVRKELIDCGFDYITTDKLTELKGFLSARCPCYNKFPLR